MISSWTLECSQGSRQSCMARIVIFSWVHEKYKVVTHTQWQEWKLNSHHCFAKKLCGQSMTTNAVFSTNNLMHGQIMWAIHDSKCSFFHQCLHQDDFKGATMPSFLTLLLGGIVPKVCFCFCQSLMQNIAPPSWVCPTEHCGGTTSSGLIYGGWKNSFGTDGKGVLWHRWQWTWKTRQHEWWCRHQTATETTE